MYPRQILIVSSPFVLVSYMNLTHYPIRWWGVKHEDEKWKLGTDDFNSINSMRIPISRYFAPNVGHGVFSAYDSFIVHLPLIVVLFNLKNFCSIISVSLFLMPSIVVLFNLKNFCSIISVSLFSTQLWSLFRCSTVLIPLYIYRRN